MLLELSHNLQLADRTDFRQTAAGSPDRVVEDLVEVQSLVEVGKASRTEVVHTVDFAVGLVGVRNHLEVRLVASPVLHRVAVDMVLIVHQYCFVSMSGMALTLSGRWMRWRRITSLRRSRLAPTLPCVRLLLIVRS